MRTLTPYPGKFEGNESQLMAQAVYQASLDGTDEELGDVDNFGWYGLVKGKRYSFILSEDSQGFVTVNYGTHAEMKAQWDKIEKAYDEFYNENG